MVLQLDASGIAILSFYIVREMKIKQDVTSSDYSKI
jgi:hypothetical protein